MNRLCRIARLLMAALPAPVVERLSEKYRLSVVFIKDVEKDMASLFPQQADLLTEWILKNYKEATLAWPEDYGRVQQSLAFYFQKKVDPKFVVLAKEVGKNPKNVLDFSLYDLEDIEEEYQNTENLADRARANVLTNTLPEGSQLYFNNGTWQIVKVDSPTAACMLGKGTKWCTSNREAAEYYLGQDPLYVIYNKGRKFAQLHFGASDDYEDFQLKNLRDKEMEIDDDLRQALLDSGLLSMALCHYEWNSGREAEQFFQYLVGEKRNPAIERVISDDPDACYFYALFVIGGRWPEAEKVIGSDPHRAFDYSFNILHGPFPEGEQAIAKKIELSIKYARLVLHNRFLLGEKFIFYGGPVSIAKYFRFLKSIGDTKSIEKLAEDHNIPRVQWLGYLP